ncbi:MAG TPA: LysM peptidoglycan-binding domain-containing protein [Burkholderiales bacterium]|nr:LysM peptidoglycan-binding domain-containing protein [Burkholderiales bacterium]
MHTLGKMGTLGGDFQRPAVASGALDVGAGQNRRRRPTEIISILALLLGCTLGAGPLAANDDPSPDEAPSSAPAADPPSEPHDSEAAPTSAPGAESTAPQLQDKAPSRYTVKAGDTLWSISSRFLKTPWKWPDVWGMNRDEVKNPHLIYPGDVIVLDTSEAAPRLRLEGVPDGGLSRWYGYELQLTKLEPRMRSSALTTAIPTIPAKDIEPFLTRPLVIDVATAAKAPRIVALADQRVVAGPNDIAYAVGIDPTKGSYWNVYRPGRMFFDPDTRETLGYEAVYLGDTEVMTHGEVTSLRLLRAVQEIGKGDRLATIPALQSLPYVPRAPARKIRGKIIAGTDSTVSEIGPLSVVILNRGARDGLESGNVLGIFRSEGMVPVSDRAVPLPEEGYGLVLVFRVFTRMSYGLIMTAQRPVHVMDIVRNP